MKDTIKTVYVVHHSHSDVGYTDLQERIIDVQVDNLRRVLEIMQDPMYKDFRWTCETYFFVEKFLDEATEDEKALFFSLVKDGHIGISGSYLNFCDLVDPDVLKERSCYLAEVFKSKGAVIKTAMNADINGISMGHRDALLASGVEFLYTNIHTHHGMYPMYQNQEAFWWQTDDGKKMLVWNGTHYHDANHFGLSPDMFRTDDLHLSDLEVFHRNLGEYLTECEDADYKHDFIVVSVSGVLGDNAPPNTIILDMVKQYNEKYGNKVTLKMVTLQDFYQELQNRLDLDKIPVVTGDFTDWWANGVGSTPLAVKHYRAAQRIFHLSKRVAPDLHEKFPELKRRAENNLLLYAEHTWGHSHSVGDPYETFVSDLDIRKTGYASNAHEAATLLLNRAIQSLGGDFKHFNLEGQVVAVYPGTKKATMSVGFHVETLYLHDAIITDSNGNSLNVQTSQHLRGTYMCFVDTFEPGEKKTYHYKLVRKVILPVLKRQNTRHAYIGRETVQDVINDYQPEYCHLHHKLENDWFLIKYRVGEGFTTLFDKKNNRELMVQGMESFFAPIYENTTIKSNVCTERGMLGRNIRGVHATQMKAILTAVDILQYDAVYTHMKFTFNMDGVKNCFLHMKMYNDMPRIEFKLGLAKNISEEIESIYMPLSIQRDDEPVYIRKGGAPFRPGVDQIPGTCMEYWMTDIGVAYFNPKEQNAVLIHTPDTPLIYMGELQHHPILLCDRKMENNLRPVYSWVMNNTWETNFRLDLSGFHEYSYALQLVDATSPEECFANLENIHYGTLSYLLKHNK